HERGAGGCASDDSLRASLSLRPSCQRGLNKKADLPIAHRPLLGVCPDEATLVQQAMLESLEVLPL
ncbi:unnamed protein product, partial [Effrenium voratum]